MVRWFKLFGDQYLGFWGLGLVLFVLQEVPYIVMPFFPLETNPIMQMTETSAALDLWEKILGSLCIALMIFVVHKDAVLFSVAGGRERLFFLLTVILLLTNYFGWALYTIPPLFYVAISLWRQNIPLTVTGLIFFAVHFIHVLGNLTR